MSVNLLVFKTTKCFWGQTFEINYSLAETLHFNASSKQCLSVIFIWSINLDRIQNGGALSISITLPKQDWKRSLRYLFVMAVQTPAQIPPYHYLFGDLLSCEQSYGKALYGTMDTVFLCQYSVPVPKQCHWSVPVLELSSKCLCLAPIFSARFTVKIQSKYSAPAPCSARSLNIDFDIVGIGRYWSTTVLLKLSLTFNFMITLLWHWGTMICIRYIMCNILSCCLVDR